MGYQFDIPILYLLVGVFRNFIDNRSKRLQKLLNKRSFFIIYKIKVILYCLDKILQMILILLTNEYLKLVCDLSY